MYQKFHIPLKMDKKPTCIFENNYVCTQFTEDNSLHDRTKHIDVKYRTIGDNVKNYRIQVESVAPEYNMADIMTKAHG